MMVKFLIGFLTVSLLLIVIYGYPVVEAIYLNAARSESVKPLQIKWTIKAVHDEEYRIFVDYVYEVNDKKFEKKERLESVKFRNPYLAEEAVGELKNANSLIWYAPRYPESASIEKFFPLKRAIYTGVLFALLSYLVAGGSLYVRYWLNKSR